MKKLLFFLFFVVKTLGVYAQEPPKADKPPAIKPNPVTPKTKEKATLEGKALDKKGTTKAPPKPPTPDPVTLRLDTVKGYSYNSFITLLRNGQPVPVATYMIGVRIPAAVKGCKGEAPLNGRILNGEPLLRMLQRLNFFRYVNDQYSCYARTESIQAEIIGIFKIKDPKGETREMDTTIKVVFDPLFTFTVGSDAFARKPLQPKKEEKPIVKALIIKHNGDSLRVTIDKVTPDYIRYYTTSPAEMKNINKNVIQEIQYADGRRENGSEKVVVSEDPEQVKIVGNFREVNGMKRKGKVKAGEKTKDQEQAFREMKQQAAKLNAHIIVVETQFQGGDKKNPIVKSGDAYGY